MQRLPEQDLDHVLEHTEGLWESIRGQSLFITGGTGFVGRWLVETFVWTSDRLRLDARAIVLTRDPQRFAGAAPHLANHPAITTVHGDVINFIAPGGTFPFVIHAATERTRTPSAGQPLGSFALDVQGTQRVLELASARGARRLLFTSSGAVYGRQPWDLANVSEDYRGAPATSDINAVYGHAKRVSEFMCASFAHVHGFDAVIARLFAFVGPLLPLDANYAVGNFIRDSLADRPIRIAGDGTPYRSYLYAADLAIWLWTLLFRGRSAFPYNVGSSSAISIADLAKTVQRATASTSGIEIARQQVEGGHPERYVPETSRAEALGLRSWIGLDDGVRRTTLWHRGAHSCR